MGGVTAPVGATVGLPGVTVGVPVVGVPVAPGIATISIVICEASGRVVPLEITIFTSLTPG